MSTKKVENPKPPKDLPKPPPPPPPPTPRVVREGCFRKGKVLRLGSIVKYNKRKHIVIRIENWKKEKVVGLVRVFKGYCTPKLLSVKYLFGRMINDLELLEE